MRASQNSSSPTAAISSAKFRDGKKSGRGTLTFPNGEKYVGEFRDDVRNGRGILFAANGTARQSGPWEDDEFRGGGAGLADQVSPPSLPQRR